MPKTIADPIVLEELKRRLQRLSADTPRRWGTLSAHAMLCHLGDAGDMALRIRPRRNAVPHRRRPVLKALALWSPVRWPRGWRTHSDLDPSRGGTTPGDFAADRVRVIAGLERLAESQAGTLEPAHGIFGLMTVSDWQRWAFKHVDHHLRQFGL